MTTQSICRTAAKAHIDLSRRTKSIAAESTQTYPFIAQIQHTLIMQLQACTDPAQREVLQSICNTLNDVPALSEAGLEKASHSGVSSDAVNNFIINLKQRALHQLDRDLSAHFKATFPPHLAKHVFNNALAESRLCALQAVSGTIAGNALLKICIGEHIAAIQKQKCCSEEALLIAQLPHIMDVLPSMLSRYESERVDFKAEQKSAITSYLQHQATTLLEANTTELKTFQKLLYDETDNRQAIMKNRDEYLEQINERFEQQNTLLADIDNAVKQGHIADIPANQLPDTLVDALHNFNHLQESLAVSQTVLQQAEHARDLLADKTNPADTARLKQLQSKLAQKNIGITSEEESLNQLKKEAGNRTQIKDLILHLKRVFGSGRHTKTGREYRDEIQRHIHSLQQLKNSQQELIRELAALKSQMTQTAIAREKDQRQCDAIVHHHQITLTSLQHQHAASRKELIPILTSEQNKIRINFEQKEATAHNQYGDSREEIVGREDEIERRKSQLEEINTRLKKIMSGDLLSETNATFLCTKLTGAVQEEARHQYAIWRDELAGRSPQQMAISTRIDELKELNVIINQVLTFGGSHVELSKINNLRVQCGLDIIPAYDVSQMKVPLTHAAALFSMLCADKVLADPLAQMFENAQALTPRTLILLTELEKKINHPEHQEKKVNTKILARVKEHLEGLRRVIIQKHEQFLLVSHDFNEQNYHPEYNVYIDRQRQHGTCSMHSWNNLLAYLTDNRRMQLTPWRTEKLIQTRLIHSAHQQLSDLMNSDTNRSGELNFRAIEQVFNLIERASDMVIPSYLSILKKQGHLMSFEENNSQHIEGTHLNDNSDELFNINGIHHEVLSSYCFNSNTNSLTQEKRLAYLSEQKFDAYRISFRPTTPDSGGHALVLVKNEEQYLLIDSNHQDPVPLKLEELIRFFCERESLPQYLADEFQKRGYTRYSDLFIRTGFFKEKNNATY